MLRFPPAVALADKPGPSHVQVWLLALGEVGWTGPVEGRARVRTKISLTPQLACPTLDYYDRFLK